MISPEKNPGCKKCRHVHAYWLLVLEPECGHPARVGTREDPYQGTVHYRMTCAHYNTYLQCALFAPKVSLWQWVKGWF